MARMLLYKKHIGSFPDDTRTIDEEAAMNKNFKIK